MMLNGGITKSGRRQEEEGPKSATIRCPWAVVSSSDQRTTAVLVNYLPRIKGSP